MFIAECSPLPGGKGSKKADVNKNLWNLVRPKTCLHGRAGSCVNSIHASHRQLLSAECIVCGRHCGGYHYNLIGFYTLRSSEISRRGSRVHHPQWYSHRDSMKRSVTKRQETLGERSPAGVGWRDRGEASAMKLRTPEGNVDFHWVWDLKVSHTFRASVFSC